MNSWRLKLVAGAVVATLLILAILFLTRSVAQVALVKRGLAPNSKPGSVTVQAEYEMDLKSEVGGRLIRSELDPGKTVKAGAFLAQIDTGDLQLEIEHIASEYEAAKQRIAIGSQIALELANARDNLENFERLTKSGNYPEAELVKQRRLVEQIRQKYEGEQLSNRQSVATYENTLKVKKRQLEKMTITAPFDGVVSDVLARPGDIIGGNTIIAHLISLSRTVEGKLSEEVFADIKLGQKVTVRFLTYGEASYSGKVSKILPTADPTTQRYIVHLQIDIPPEKLVPGITGEMVIDVDVHVNTLIVPRRAVLGRNLYVVNGGRVELRKVELGYVSLNEVEVLSGVKEGEQVIVEQPDRFRVGDRVRAEVEK
jgi:RND family efflux transporter MFP subunit